MKGWAKWRRTPIVLLLRNCLLSLFAFQWILCVCAESSRVQRDKAVRAELSLVGACAWTEAWWVWGGWANAHGLPQTPGREPTIQPSHFIWKETNSSDFLITVIIQQCWKVFIFLQDNKAKSLVSKQCQKINSDTLLAVIHGVGVTVWQKTNCTLVKESLNLFEICKYEESTLNLKHNYPKSCMQENTKLLKCTINLCSLTLHSIADFLAVRNT